MLDYGFYGYLFRHLRPAEGWVVGLLLTLAVLSLPWAVGAANWLPGASNLWLLAWLTMLVGLRLARARRARLLLGSAAVGIVVFTTVLIAGAVPRPSALMTLLRDTPAWLLGSRAGEWPGAEVTRTSAAALADFARRMLAWGAATRGITESQDTLPILWLAAVLLSLAALWAGWVFRRWRNATVALAPTAVLATAHYIFAPLTGVPFVLFVGAAIGLLAQARYLALVEKWARQGIDYSDEIHLDLNLATAIAVVLIPIAAWAIPMPILYGPARAAWNAFEQPREAAAAIARRALGPIQRPPVQGLFSGPTAVTDLPYSRVLAGPITLSEQIVFQVRTNDPPPISGMPAPPNRYWRTDTFDVYTGRGWDNTTWTDEAVPGVDINATLAALPPGGALVQRYTLSTDAPVAMANAPVAFDQPATRLRRAADDIIDVTLQARTYTVVSRLPGASIPQLRRAPPADLLGYVALPNSVPTRVRELAQSLTASQSTVYDKVMAVEAHLRAMPYTLDVPAPPPGRDVADYLLFDVQAGYCDYMATTMVVMLRSLGIPARLASGYIGGQYDMDSGAWRVTGQEAHAWPEVYFTGIGWVEFEPTPGRAPITRPEQEGPIILTGEVPRVEASRRPWLLALGALVSAAAVMAGVVTLRRAYRRARFARLPVAQQVRMVWGDLAQRAARLGHPPDPAQTPNEYAADLGRDLGGQSITVGPWQLDGHGVEAPLADLGHIYTATTYAAASPDATEGRQALAAWSQVGPRVWLLARRRWAEARRRASQLRSARNDSP